MAITGISAMRNQNLWVFDTQGCSTRHRGWGIKPQQHWIATKIGNKCHLHGYSHRQKTVYIPADIVRLTENNARAIINKNADDCQPTSRIKKYEPFMEVAEGAANAVLAVSPRIRAIWMKSLHGCFLPSAYSPTLKHQVGEQLLVLVWPRRNIHAAMKDLATMKFSARVDKVVKKFAVAQSCNVVRCCQLRTL